MEFNQKLFVSRLRELLDEKEITQKELSSRIGVSEVTVSRYLSGDRTPRTDVINSISNFFNVSADYLLGNSDIRNPYKEAPENTDEDIDLWLSKTDGYKELPEEDRELISNLAKNLLEKHRKEK